MLRAVIKTGHSWVFEMSYSPDNTKIATGGAHEGGVRIWNSKTGNLLFKECDAADTGRVVLQETVVTRGLAWVSDGKKLIGASNSSILIWDTAAWKPIAHLRSCYRDVRAISLSPNDRILASGTDDCTARLWNLDTNLQIGLPLRHEHYVACIALSGDGKVLVTACEDGNVYVWDMYAVLEEAGLDSDLLSIPNVASEDSLRIYHRFRLAPTVLLNRLSLLFRPSQTTSSSQGQAQASSLHT